MGTSQVNSRGPARPGLKAIVALSVGLFLLSEGVGILTALPPWLLYADVGGAPGESLRALAIGWLNSNVGRNLMALQPITSVVNCLMLILAVTVTAGGAAYLWRRAGRTRNSVALAAAALVLCAYAAGTPIAIHFWATDLAARLKGSAAATQRALREKLESGTVSAERRDRVWRLYAAEEFLNTGERVEIPARGGGTRLYEPSDGEIKFREWREDFFSSMRPSWQPVATWGSLAAAGAAVGYRVARRKDDPAPPGSRS